MEYVPRMSVNIENLTVQELIELNGQIINRIKELRKQEQVRAVSQFRLGDVVSFTHKYNQKIIGLILSVRKTKISILTEDNEQWTVSPGLLSPEEAPSKKLLKLLEEIFPKAMRASFPTKK